MGEPMNQIIPTEASFKNELAFLSNMYKAKIIMSPSLVGDRLDYYSKFFEFDNKEYPASENLYQALKNRYLAGRDDFRWITPFEAKSRGFKIPLSDIWNNWKARRLIAMELVIDLKFNSWPHLLDMLINTPDDKLVEWNTWNDTFWGKSIKTGKGENNLGEILKRKKYRAIWERLQMFK